MLDPNKKFIITKDENTAKSLFNAGFSIISQNDGLYKFLNNPPKNFTFSNIDMKKIVSTNILSM